MQAFDVAYSGVGRPVKYSPRLGIAMPAKCAMSQEAFNFYDTVIKGIGVVALIASGIFAWTQFKEGQEREYKKAFYEQQVSVIGSVFDVMTEIDTASSKEERAKALKKFWMIHQGTGRAFLSSTMFESLNGLPLDYVRGCIAELEKPKIKCSNFSASQSMSAFAKVAREELAQNWSLEFSQIGAEDPWLPKSLQQSN